MGELGGEPVGELAGAVRGDVVDDEHEGLETGSLEDFPESAHHRIEVLALVVRGKANDDSTRVSSPRWPQRFPKRRARRALDLLADLLELDGPTPSASRPTAAPRPGSGVGRPWLSSRSKSRATRIPGIGGTIDAKIVELAETGDLRPSPRSVRVSRRGSSPSRHVPGLGPKTAGRSGRSSAITERRGPAQAAEAQRLRGLAGLGARRRRSVLAHLSEPRANLSDRKHVARTGRSPPFRTVGRGAERAPGRDRGLGSGRGPPPRRDVEGLDVIATASEPEELIGLSRVPAGRGGGGEGPDEGDRSLRSTACLRPARRPARVLRQPPAALHRLDGPQRRAARGRRAAGLLGLRVRRRDGRVRRALARPRPRRSSTRSSATVDPARAPREPRRARRRAEGSCPTSSGSETSRATSTCTPTGRTDGTRSTRWSPRP